MSGMELKELATGSGLTPIDVCHEAGISDSTLYKVYNDEHVRQSTKIKVQQAIERLAAKARGPTT